MEQYTVTGMSCAACSTRVEKAVSKVEGVTSCSVSLLTNSMGHMMWNWPLPSFFADNHVAMGLVQLLLTVVIMVINQKFFVSGFQSLWHRAPNMDTLVALGAGAAFVYSTYALFAMTDAQVKGNMDAVMTYMHEFYFESAAMILTLITVGNGMGAKNGILFKTAVSLEEAGKINIVALDKTGTVTSGEPKVTDIMTAQETSEDELVQMAACLEKRSEHPLAKAVMEYAEGKKIKAQETENFKVLPGNGLTAELNGAILSGGNDVFISKQVQIPEEISDKARSLAAEGKTPLFFAKDEKLLGVIAVADVIRQDSRGAIEELRNMGIRVVMLTGAYKG